MSPVIAFRYRGLAAFGLSFFGVVWAVYSEEAACLTSASQVYVQAQSGERRVVKIRLEGTVYGVDRRHQALALKDDSGFVWLEKLSYPESVGPGVQVAIEGMAALGVGKALMQATPVVEQDWNTGNAARAGFMRLEAGRHPFELTFYQGIGPSRLEVFYEGPVAYASIPSEALFCADPSGSGQIIPGVRFERFEGTWNALPDCRELQPAGTGVTTNFSLGVGEREENFALRFTGFLEVRQPGDYRFSITADDGAQLFIYYDASNQLRVAGTNSLTAPDSIEPGQNWQDRSEPFFAEVEGIVRQVGRHGDQLQLELTSDVAGRMQVTVSDATGAVPDFLLESRIRARGLCRSALSHRGSKLAGYLLVPTLDDLFIIQPAEMLWLTHPVCAVSDVTNSPVANPSGTIVRLEGTAVEVLAGESLVLQDASGRIRVLTKQASVQDQGSRIEVIGQWFGDRDRPELRGAIYRPAVVLAEGGTLPTLTSIEQVRHLNLTEAGQRYPVSARGVVTFAFTGGYRAHVQGENEGLYVSGPRSPQFNLRVGEMYQFDGTTSTGLFSRVIQYRTAIPLGKGQSPEPLRPTWEQLMNGSLDSEWVEVQGVVQQVVDRDMIIAMRGGLIAARFFHPDVSDLLQYRDAAVRVQGTVRARANRARQVETVYVQVASPLQLTVDRRPPDDPFSTPSKLVTELRQFDPDAATYRLVKTKGQVIHIRDRTGYMMDGTNGMRFVLRDNADLAAGDLVEVVGLPHIQGPSPVLEQALARAFDHTNTPAARLVSTNDLLSRFNDSTRVCVEATLLGFRTNQTDQVLDLQTGSRFHQARLEHARGSLPPIPVGSVLQVEGTYVGQGLESGASESVQSFELLLNAPADVVILRRPSWWTPQRMVAVVGGLAFVLGVAAIWITLLRRQVESRTRDLRAEVESHKRTEAELEVEKTKLENEIEERKRIEREVEKTHRELVDLSRKAGQAEVASSVLHNVGNVLNSVNVSAGLIAERVREMRLVNIGKAAEMMEHHQENLGQWIAEDAKGRQLPGYLKSLGRQLLEEQEQVNEEICELSQNVEHIKEIVAMQQSYSRVAGVEETISVADLAENAIKMESGGFMRHGINIVREYEDTPQVTVDKHRVLQILVNLLRNAKYACDGSRQPEKQVRVRISSAGAERVRIEVTDNGIGISPQNLVRIFSHGFTTRRDGHGLGLHSSALAAKELGGKLSVHSDGPGHGASFVLEFPRQKQSG